MPKIQVNDREQLDSVYNINTIDGVLGLTLESWGPKDRNPDYAKAMEKILSRLKENGVPSINVYVVSRNLTKAFPKLRDRAIKIGRSTDIGLINADPHDLRLAIGREVADLKENPLPDSQGGNRFKRILIHSPLLSENDWHVIASTTDKLNVYKPTAKPEKLERLVTALQKQELGKPEGAVQPKQSTISSVAYLRDPLVKAWVLKNALGICEACSSPAPFSKSDGSPYLEVHHLQPLSEGGSDTVENTVAVCPNCHRRLHYGNDRDTLMVTIRSKVNRLGESNVS